jgi:hypothetical protein
MNLTSLAAVKRACTTDARLELVDVENMPWLAMTMKMGPRSIVKAQTNAIAVLGYHRNGGEFYERDLVSWIYWPKAAELETHGDDTFTLRFAHDRKATYRVVAA